MLIDICLLVMFALLVAMAGREIARGQADLRRFEQQRVITKELASWDRTKELGFNDVLDWEAGFQEMTGELPAGSKTMELASRVSYISANTITAAQIGVGLVVGAPTRTEWYQGVPWEQVGGGNWQVVEE